MNVFKCVICNKKKTEYGNNPSPIKHKGLCCDVCNMESVIPERLALCGIDEQYVIDVLLEVAKDNKRDKGKTD